MTTPHPDMEEITLEDVSTHIYELQSTSSSQDLGIQQRSTDLSVTLNDTEYNFTQSVTSLNSKGSTTGFVLWKVSLPFVKWLLNSKIYDIRGKYILELGSGVTGLFACVLGPLCGRYVATDQSHLLKLLKQNIQSNVYDVESETIEGIVLQKKKKKKRSNETTPQVDAVEFDWEEPEQGVYELEQFIGKAEPDYVIGCDIVYNDYLVPYLTGAIDRVCGAHTTVLIGLQVRLPENIELFVETMLDKGFKVFRHTPEMLSEALQNGFVVYNIHRSTIIE